MKNQKLNRLSFAALFAALTAIFIYFVHIPYFNTGYIHIGDAVIFLCAALLPTPYAVPACAIGGGLADLLSGYPLYIVPTVLIKGLMALCLSSKTPKLLCKRNVLGALGAAAINIFLYAVAEFIFALFFYVDKESAVGALAVAASTLPQNAIQGAASVAVFLPLAAGLDKFRAKETFHL